jgi:hypothetical protein
MEMALPMPNIGGNVPPLSTIKDVLVTVSTYLWLNRRSKSDKQQAHSSLDSHSNTLVGDPSSDIIMETDKQGWELL